MDLSSYLALIPTYHSTRPKFMHTLATLLRPMIDAQAMLRKLTADFDLDTAVGVQLDAVGRWIGRDRFVNVPLVGVFFSFDTIDVGLDQGVWLGPFDATDGVRALDDDTYRDLLRLQAIANHWPGYLEPIVEAMNAIWPGVVTNDRGDVPGGRMTANVLIPDAAITTILLYLLEQDYPIKASGVRYNFIETSLVGAPLFGFDVSNATIDGFDVGAWGKIVYET